MRFWASLGHRPLANQVIAPPTQVTWAGELSAAKPLLSPSLQNVLTHFYEHILECQNPPFHPYCLGSLSHAGVMMNEVVGMALM